MTSSHDDRSDDGTISPPHQGVDPRLFAAKEGVSDEWLRRPGVNGIGIGLDHDGNDVITVTIDPTAGPRSLGLPRQLEGYQVQTLPLVLEFPASTATSPAEAAEKKDLAADYKRYNPLEGGISIASNKTNGIGHSLSGTLGIIMTSSTEQRPVLLSCCHVLYANGGTEKTEIFQPGNNNTPKDLIAKNLRGLKENYQVGDQVVGMDAAIALLVPDGDPDRTARPMKILDVVEPLVGWENPARGQPVRKRGFTTEATSGTVFMVGFDWHFDAGESMKNQFLIVDLVKNSFSAPGDSGAVVYTPYDKLAVGLLCNGYSDPTTGVHYTSATPFPAVAQVLHLEM